MAKISKEKIEAWRQRVVNYLAEKEPHVTISIVTKGVDAWTIAHMSGIVREAYAMADVHDAHIQTALQSIFPNVIFRDKKVY